jgi:hypothetical protein
MRKMNFVNDSQKISAPVIYWRDWPWAVVLDMNNVADRLYDCAVPLVTDDAQFLILLATGPAFNSALRVYRKGDYSSDRTQDGTVKGVLVRDIKLEELWPATKIDRSGLWTDHTPEWFAGGSFDFTPGNLQLIHKTRWGSTVRIYLPDGEPLKECKRGLQDVLFNAADYASSNIESCAGVSDTVPLLPVAGVKPYPSEMD